jgi:hypothetical protein
MLIFDRKTKIVLAVFVIIIFLSIVSFFVLKRQAATPPEESASLNQDPATLPSRSTPDSSSPDQTSAQSSPATAPTQGSFPANEYNLQKQALDSYIILSNDPNLIASAKNIQKDFGLDDMGTAFPSATAKLQNGDEILILAGCKPHNCGGTEKIIAYDKKEEKTYIFIEKYDTATGYEILGNPSDEIRSLLIFYYKNK